MRPEGQTEVVVRRAGAADVRALSNLIKQFAVESGESRHSVSGEATLAKALRHLTVFIAYSDDEPTGYSLGMESLGGRGSATPEMPGYYLGDLFIAKHWRQLGLGRALLSAILQTTTSWGPTRFLRWEMSTRPEYAATRAFYDAILPERHVGVPFVWEAPAGAATVSPERYMAFRPRRLMTPKAWLSLEPAFATQGGRWFARLHELAGLPEDYPALLDALASDGYAYLSMAEGLDLPEGGAATVFKGSYRLEDAEACLVVFPEKSA